MRAPTQGFGTSVVGDGFPVPTESAQNPVGSGRNGKKYSKDKQNGIEYKCTNVVNVQQYGS